MLDAIEDRQFQVSHTNTTYKGREDSGLVCVFCREENFARSLPSCLLDHLSLSQSWGKGIELHVWFKVILLDSWLVEKGRHQNKIWRLWRVGEDNRRVCSSLECQHAMWVEGNHSRKKSSLFFWEKKPQAISHSQHNPKDPQLDPGVCADLPFLLSEIDHWGQFSQFSCSAHLSRDSLVSPLQISRKDFSVNWVLKVQIP